MKHSINEKVYVLCVPPYLWPCKNDMGKAIFKYVKMLMGGIVLASWIVRDHVNFPVQWYRVLVEPEGKPAFEVEVEDSSVFTHPMNSLLGKLVYGYKSLADSLLSIKTSVVNISVRPDDEDAAPTKGKTKPLSPREKMARESNKGISKSKSGRKDLYDTLDKYIAATGGQALPTHLQDAMEALEKAESEFNAACKEKLKAIEEAEKETSAETLAAEFSQSAAICKDLIAESVGENSPVADTEAPMPLLPTYPISSGITILHNTR